MNMLIERRVMDLIEQSRRNPGDCWPWAGYVGADGYGRLSAAARYGLSSVAHRLSYERLVGPIPVGLTIDHLCKNRACINPAHLEPVSMRENNRRSDNVAGIAGRKTHCDHGHEFTAENTRMVKGRYGPTRDCITCRRRRTREAMQRQRNRAKGGR